mmetsp:Transcript_13133/g.15996  ORF Transcript_13133/g.15996 Transcript_13133/m.15996 type:complete len:511 (+) Transcript_13133:122-1654(+)
MKGNQGLEALATLCGGASKAAFNETSTSNENFNQPAQNIQNQNNGNSNQSRQLEHFANPPVAMGFVHNLSESNTSNNQQTQALNNVNPQFASLLNAGLSQQNLVNSMASSSNEGALQQMLYLKLLQNQAASANAASFLNVQTPAASGVNNSFLDQNAALAMVLALQQQEAAAVSNQIQSQQFQKQEQQQQPQQQQHSQFHQIIPPPPSQNNKSNSTNNASISQSNSFPAPLPKTKTDTSSGNVPGSPANSFSHQPILMRNTHSVDGDSILSSNQPQQEENIDEVMSNGAYSEDKKLLKRAANRRSAQLSRKRKKQFIECLRDENAELRRMELILRSIPDLVISFDSSGKIGFVSQSVNKFLEFMPEELEGKSFWERLCEDSVRLLKAAFMDALAARENNSTSTPLGKGIWELRLQDKNGDHILVTLNGVVHFTGDAPECVCSMRLRGKSSDRNKNDETQNQTDVITTSLKPRVLPHQSVFKNGVAVKLKINSGRRNAAQISDVESTSTSD